MDEIGKHSELAIFFQNINHQDVKTIEGEVSLREFIAGMLSYYPGWILFLYRIRGLFVRILGLVKHERPETLPFIKPADLPFSPGENASFFIVRMAKEDTYWISETPPDKHLTAFLGVVVEQLNNNRSRFHVFTTVRFIHWTGNVYFNLIRPFHHLVVSRMMRAAIQ